MHVAALLASLAGLWIILFSATRDVTSLIVAGVVAVGVVLWIARLGGVDGESAPLWRLLRLAPLSIGRFFASARGAAGTARMALAADVPMRPALVRVRLRAQSDAARAALTHFISADPGGLVVDVDREGLLVHVLQEDAVDAPQLARVENGVIGALEGGQR